MTADCCVLPFRKGTVSCFISCNASVRNAVTNHINTSVFLNKNSKHVILQRSGQTYTVAIQNVKKILLKKLKCFEADTNSQQSSLPLVEDVEGKNIMKSITHQEKHKKDIFSQP